MTAGRRAGAGPSSLRREGVDMPPRDGNCDIVACFGASFGSLPRSKPQMKSTYNGTDIPADGHAIEYSGDQFRVPDRPIIPYIEGDGTGRDIWKASRRVFDAAVEKAYGGNRS